MTQTTISTRGRSSSLADVLEIVLDKGIVIDAFVRVSVVGIELLTIEARIVIASVDTFIRYAEAMARLDLMPQANSVGLPGLVRQVTQDVTKTEGTLPPAPAPAAVAAQTLAVEEVRTVETVVEEPRSRRSKASHGDDG